MRNRRTVPFAVVAVLSASMLTGCSGSSESSSAAATPTTTITPAAVLGSKLLPLIIKPPFGYEVDPTAGATGTITPAAFTRLGGAGSAAKTGYITGYRQTYVSSGTEEGLTVTVMKFASTVKAKAYLESTSPRTMSLVAPTNKPFTQVPGAIELDGTKPYEGEYQHGVVMSRGPYYASVVYVTSQPVQLPFEFYDWAKIQYLSLQ